MSAPDDVRVRYASATRAIAVAWQPTPGASDYRLQLVDDGGAPVSSQPAFAISGNTASCGPLSLTPGRRYRVQVAARIGDQASSWAAASFTPLDLAAPADLACAGDRATLRATWQAVANASSYAVAVTNPNGSAVEPAPQFTVQGLSATIAGLQLGKTYRVSVHGVTAEVDGGTRSPTGPSSRSASR